MLLLLLLGIAKIKVSISPDQTENYYIIKITIQPPCLSSTVPLVTFFLWSTFEFDRGTPYQSQVRYVVCWAENIRATSTKLQKQMSKSSNVLIILKTYWRHFLYIQPSCLSRTVPLVTVSLWSRLGFDIVTPW